ncbi:MAG TPA: hypothetical protein QF556_05530, partial [Rhodospirillales bacterium]|nr:hypothetical protein [Rhodospirillales bacterium]
LLPSFPSPPGQRLGTASLHVKCKILPRRAFANHVDIQDRLSGAIHPDSTCRAEEPKKESVKPQVRRNEPFSARWTSKRHVPEGGGVQAF